MIKITKAFVIECDNCFKEFEDYSGFSLFSDGDNAHPEDRGWYVHDEVHYCPDCHTINDDDEVIVKGK